MYSSLVESGKSGEIVQSIGNSCRREITNGGGLGNDVKGSDEKFCVLSSWREWLIALLRARASEARVSENEGRVREAERKIYAKAILNLIHGRISEALRESETPVGMNFFSIICNSCADIDEFEGCAKQLKQNFRFVFLESNL